MLKKTLLHFFIILFTVCFWVGAMPPYNVSEAAYFLFVPFLIWVLSQPSKKQLWLTSLFCGFSAWFCILIWLRHVTWIGTTILSLILGIYFLIWILYVSVVIRNSINQTFIFRFFGFLGIAGSWVVLEYLRSFLLYGMPMGPLALSQWQRPAILQLSAWTGAYGVSFFLIFFNCCILKTVLQLKFVGKKGVSFLKFFKLDFYFVIISIIGLLYLYYNCLPKNVIQKNQGFEFAVMQPNFEPLKSWDVVKNNQANLSLKRQLEQTALLDYDLLFLPEAVTPNPILGDKDILELFTSASNRNQKPFIIGNLAYDMYNGGWYNGIFLVDPNLGLNSDYYRKRKLVPFGEYTPDLFFWIEPLAGIQGSFMEGNDAAIIELRIADKKWQVGALVCYEDLFPSLVRETVLAGADFLFVATNDSWYGEEGGAYFHAAHSVLRSVENRRATIRCGNAGWSGWIDSLGRIRGCLTNQNNDIYFKGSGTFSFTTTIDEEQSLSFYTKHGEWFVFLSVILSILGYFITKSRIS